jgi:hypothetical protein
MKAWQVRELGEPRDVLTLAEVPAGLQRLAGGGSVSRIVFVP